MYALAFLHIMPLYLSLDDILGEKCISHSPESIYFWGGGYGISTFVGYLMPNPF